MTKDCRADVELTPTLSTTLNTFVDPCQNAAKTRLSGHPQLATLPPLSSSFVSDGVVFEEKLESEKEKAVIFRSLVAKVKLQPALDSSLEAKAVKFLQSVKILYNLFAHCSPEILVALIKADLIPQLVSSLNPLSQSFAEDADIHLNVMKIIQTSLWYATPGGLTYLELKDGNEQQAVHETILKQVLIPSEKYIWHLCANRFSIVDGGQSETFLEILAQLLQISPYYQPTMEIVLHMPVILTIPSCLSFFKDDYSKWYFVRTMNRAQLEWMAESRDVQQMGKKVHRMLRMEGFEDAMEKKLQNDRNEYYGRCIVEYSIDWNHLQGINLPEPE
ncbi:hypothetical protein BLNAU_12073 [Blattamonas nauphoetae]|uniref:Uncharacterized protein n=1 Tax=Blattamonas nauphoetae TaxID=2049346 RepID=A0ABQ9XNJ0_9EUKA|nr:hypothetical protein BLNAU_12073 [Blattamonas nauphoetae]